MENNSFKYSYYVDTHAHIYLSDFEDLDDVLAESKRDRVAKIMMPNVDFDTIESMEQVEIEYPGMCQSMMGLHPCSVNEDWKEKLKAMEDRWQERDYVGVGETGLDYHWDLSYVDEQQKAFERQLSWARQVQRPAIIHSRQSWRETIDTVAKLQDGRLTGVFHCFGESRELMKEIIDLGFYVGIGGVFTFKKVTLREEIEKYDLDHIVLETDSPYLSPVPFRGKRNEPKHIAQIAQCLADSLGMSIEKVRNATTRNAHDLFPQMRKPEENDVLVETKNQK